MNRFLWAVLLAFSVNVQAQECATPASPNRSFNHVNKSFLQASNPICINVAFHIVRESNGQNGFNVAQINDVVSNLNDAFNPHNISINKVSTDYIDDSDYFDLNLSLAAPKNFSDLKQVNNVQNALDFYIVNTIDRPNNNGIIQGVAESIIGLNVAVRKSQVLRQTSAHEIGHCLNLYHTHHGTYPEGGDPNECPETATNGAVCGDYVVDTPADPLLIAGTFGNFDANNCVYIGDNTYAPDVRNIMSSGRTCRRHFSNGQGLRMRQALNNAPELQTIICGNEFNIAGDQVLCHGENETYTIQNASAPYTWTTSSPLSFTPTGKKGKSISVSINDPNYQGPAEIQVTHTYGTTTLTIWIGAPLTPAVDGPTTIAPSHTAQYNVLNHSIGSTYTWEYPNGWDNNPNITGPWSWGKPNGDFDGLIEITATNQCGSSPVADIYVLVENDGDGDPRSSEKRQFIVYPNPALGKIYIKEDLAQNSKNTTPNKIISIELFDRVGTLKASSTTLNQLDLSTLNQGLYTLKIQSTTGLEYHQIIVRH